ncbi:amidohydrolase [Bradyrhizobium sp. HKCCYLRH1065]|uniref:amidohydrolase n=1 Tax=unclassified Bradyrhizobium TaxID=2631580 RepID=UPI003EB8756D
MCIACGSAIGSLFAASKPEGGGLTRRQMVATTAAAAAFAAAGSAPAFAAPNRTTVFRGGRVYTVEDSQPWAAAVVVKGDKIVYVGDDAGAMKFAGRGAEVIDLKGRMLMPGFVEAHWHLCTLAFARGAWVNEEDPERISEILRDYAKTHSDEKFILGFGWIAGAFPASGPRKEPLDAIFPDRPVLLVSCDLHSYWVNSKLLEMAGITKDTPRDVVPGSSWYEKDPNGEPTGFISEVPALFAVLKTLEKHGIEPFGLKSAAAAIEEWQPKLAAAGITTLFDAGFSAWPTEQHHGFDMLVDLESRGKLLQRVIGSLYHNDPNVDPLPIIRAYRKRYRTPLVKAEVLKLIVDGTELSRTAYLLDPYAGRQDWRGEPLLPSPVMNRILREAHAEGIDTHLHAVGDAAVRMSLDGYEAAFGRQGPGNRRHTICHAFLTAPSDIARFRKLGLIANTQIQWGVPDTSQRRIREIYGEERWSRMYSFKTFIDQGVTVSFGMDALATGSKVVVKPLEAVQAGHTRQEPGKPDGLVHPPAAERLSLPQLIRGYTINGAYQMRMEDKIGSIKVGKLADLIVLEKNLFDVGPHEIGKVNVQLTMMNGRITHRDRL